MDTNKASSAGTPHEITEEFDVARRDDVQKLRPHALGLMGVLFIALAGAAPMSAMFGNVPIAVGFGNGTAAAGGFILGTILLLLFSVGYVAMVRKYTSAGGFYSFISHGLGRPAGMAAGWSSMAAYCLFEAGEWGIFAFFTKSTFKEYLGIDLPWLVYAFAGCALVALLTYFDVELSAKILGVALLLEAAVLLIMDLFILFKGGKDGIDYSPLSLSGALNGSNIAAAAPGVGIFFALWSWVGFECTANYAEEAKDPRRMVPRATYIAVIALGILYTLTAWAGVLGHGLTNASDDAANDAGNFFYSIASTFVNPASKDIMSWLIITSTFACAMAFHTAATRYYYAMGREGIFSKKLGRTHPKWQSPDVASFFQSAVAAVLIVVFVLIWKATPSMQEFADFENAPYFELYGWFAIMGTFWVLLMMGLSGLATIAVFAKAENRNGTHWFKWLVAPALSSAGLFYALYLLWSNIKTLGGDIGVVVALPWLASGWVVIGLVLALVIKARRPQEYETLGRMLHSGL